MEVKKNKKILHAWPTKSVDYVEAIIHKDQLCPTPKYYLLPGEDL